MSEDVNRRKKNHILLINFSVEKKMLINIDYSQQCRSKHEHNYSAQQKQYKDVVNSSMTFNLKAKCERKTESINSIKMILSRGFHFETTTWKACKLISLRLLLWIFYCVQKHFDSFVYWRSEKQWIDKQQKNRLCFSLSSEGEHKKTNATQSNTFNSQ